jgi:hypothetical protein
MEKMIMNFELAEALMDALACVAISADGGIKESADGEISQEQITYAENYAKNTFITIMDSWEELTGKKWQVVEDE